MISDSLVTRIARAISDAEGFGRPGTVPNRANNPGDLTDDGDIGNGTIQSGGPHGAKITIYATPADGWAALQRKIRRMLSGESHEYPLTLTIDQMAYRYAGDPTWGVNVARELGVDPSTKLQDLVQQDAALQQNA